MCAISFSPHCKISGKVDLRRTNQACFLIGGSGSAIRLSDSLVLRKWREKGRHTHSSAWTSVFRGMMGSREMGCFIGCQDGGSFTASQQWGHPCHRLSRNWFLLNLECSVCFVACYISNNNKMRNPQMGKNYFCSFPDPEQNRSWLAISNPAAWCLVRSCCAKTWSRHW